MMLLLMLSRLLLDPLLLTCYSMSVFLSTVGVSACPALAPPAPEGWDKDNTHHQQASHQATHYHHQVQHHSTLFLLVSTNHKVSGWNYMHLEYLGYWSRCSWLSLAPRPRRVGIDNTITFITIRR